MKKFSATWVLLPAGELARNHTVVVGDEGHIMEVAPGILPDAEFFEGILCPGFINAHGHLELSYMKDMIRPHRGLVGFIEDMISVRQKVAVASNIMEQAFKADYAMWNSGIQAAGDICNTDFTVSVKSKSKIRYHSFVELFNLSPDQAMKTFHQGEVLFGKFDSASLSGSITPHAPYSLSKQLFQRIRDHCNVYNSLWCIHHQETEEENSESGSVIQFLKNNGFVTVKIDQEGGTSTEFISGFFPESSNLMLVHNTYTNSNDIEILKSTGAIQRIFFCLCPNANLYIENRLPDIILLRNSGGRIVIGTDSLASNHSLSILDELKTIHQHYPHIPVADLLTWATANGADYFGWNDLGRFVSGPHPGVLHITNADDGHLATESKVVRIL